MTTMIEVEPQPRIDTLVRLPDGSDARRTDYIGTVWFDGKPEATGLTLRRPAHAPRGIRVPTLQASFFLPDSLPYRRDALGGATLSLSAALCGSGGDSGAIISSAAVFSDDPSGTPTWIQVHVHGYLGWPAGVGYRVVALTPPEAVR